MNYQIIYNQIIERAKLRKLTCYKEKHHIIPKCIGGSNKKENLVYLTAREHYLCHMLLVEIYPTNNSLKYAIWCMCNLKDKNQKRHKITSRTYERLKNEYSIIKSRLMKRKTNPFKTLEQTLERRKMLSERAKKTFTGRKQTLIHKQKRFENSKTTIFNRTKEEKKRISEIAKRNGVKAHKKINMEIENILTGIKFNFYGTYKDLEEYIKENYKDKPFAQSLSFTAKGLYKSTKNGWKVTLIPLQDILL